MVENTSRLIGKIKLLSCCLMHWYWRKNRHDFHFLLSNTNKVSWRQIQTSQKQELLWCLQKTELTGWQDLFPPAYMQSASLLEWEATPSGLKSTCPENDVFVPQSSAHVKFLHSSFLACPLGHQYIWNVNNLLLLPNILLLSGRCFTSLKQRFKLCSGLGGGWLD